MKRFLAALAVAPFSLLSPAFAGDFYINVEANSYIWNGDHEATQTLLHVGFRDVKGKWGYYVQGGPLVTSMDGYEEWEEAISFESGVAYHASKNLKVYGEVSSFIMHITPGVDDVQTKLGAEWVF